MFAELLQDEGHIVSRARTSRDGVRLPQRVESGLIDFEPALRGFAITVDELFGSLRLEA